MAEKKTESTFLTREDILSSPVKTDTVEAFGGKIRVTELPASLVQEMLDSGMLETTPSSNEEGTLDINVNIGKVNFSKIASQVMVDEKGEPMFSIDDVEKLQRKSFGDIQTVFYKAFELTDFGATTDLPKE